MRSNLVKNHWIVWSISCILFITGCGGCEEQKPLENIDLTPEAEEFAVHFKHFDRDLFNTDFANPAAASQQLYQKYGSFFCHFVENDLHLAACLSDSVGALLVPFVKHEDISKTYKDIQAVYTDEKRTDIEKRLTTLVRRWRHFFPDSIAPTVVFYQSAWNNNIAPVDTSLAIALDCYLGANHTVTQSLPNEQFPKYKKENMDERYLVADAAKGWVARRCGNQYQEGDFLNELLFYGKLMYIADALAPDENEAQMMAWSEEQLAWANANEYRVWKEMANEKIMYQKKRFEINRWFADAPFTNAASIPQESPPQLGIWMGWKIIKQYMAAHPDVTMQQLLAEKNNQKILSNFKPAKPQ